MQTHSPNPYQQNFLHKSLFEELNPAEPLLKLGQAIPWEYFEDEFKNLYSPKGRPAKPVRLMVGLCILKHLENLSDERLIDRWIQNPYYQAFCGAMDFQWKQPCDSTDLVYFRKRIGKEGFEKIFAVSIALHGKAAKEKEVCIDTTVQEKNVTFPTDDKKAKKIIDACHTLSERYAIKLRRSYRRELKKVLLKLRFRRHPKQAKLAKKASKRLKTIAGTLVRELKRKLPKNTVDESQEKFEMYEKVLSQKRGDKNKIYSLHEPHIYCMSKGKAHKKYEFGVKASITKTKNNNIIVGAMVFEKNIHDTHTLVSVLDQVERLAKFIPDVGLVDRGYRGKKKVGVTRIMIPDSRPKESQTQYAKRKQRKRFRKRAGIEPIIGHLKSDHRLGRNFLSGFLGDEINVLMAAAGFNFRKWLVMVSFWLKRMCQFGKIELCCERG